jgi:uncharacterized RDD family membrane protein YckC
MPLICVNPQCDHAQRKGLIENPALQFCPTCGNRLEVTGPVDVPPAQPLSRGRRVAAFLIDLVVAIILEAIASVLGTLSAILLALFWLLRDINGASPGKIVLGLVVQNRAGGPSTASQRILRNLPFAISALPLVVPVLGTAVAYPTQLILLVVETILVLSTGERIGDKLAGTKVAMRSSSPPQYYSAAGS